MKKRNKGLGVIITLITLIVVCLGCGTIGFLESNKTDADKPNKENKDYKVVYRYYLDGEEVEEEIKQEYIDNPNEEFEGAEEEIPSYTYEKYICSNNVTGEWDEENWEFKPELTANTTCRLYFIRNIHQVTFKANNGTLPNNQLEEIKTIELNKEGIINITPKEGHKFDTVICTNEIIAEYNEETKDLTVKNVIKDGICTISFGISDYTAEVKASNGTVSEDKKSARFGGTLTFDVTPSENYQFDKVICTNDQNASYNDGKLTITGITNDTVCTVQFKSIKFAVNLEVINGKLTSKSPSPQTTGEGGTVSFEIEANEGYQITGAIPDCGANVKTELSGNAVFVYNVKNDLTCKITLPKKTTTN